MTSRLRAYSGGGSGSSLSLIHPEAIYDINFASGQWFGALPSDLVVSRASEALTLTAGNTYANFASNTARITGNGLMIEEARTNSIRNPRGSGAVIGAPGTLPTNWGEISIAEIVATGTEDGLPYVDIRFSGAPGDQLLVTPDVTVSQTAAANLYTGGIFVKLISGSLSPVGGNLSIRIIELTPSVNVIGSGNFTPTGSALSSQFVSVSGTTSPATTSVRFDLFSAFASGSFDITLRIAAPMLRQASFAGSPILNADGVTSSATTQPADVVYLPISGVGTEYTVFCQLPIPAAHVNYFSAVEMWNSSTNRVNINVNQTAQDALIVQAGAGRAIGGAASGGARKIAVRIAAANSRICANTVLGAVDTGIIPAVAPTRTYFGSAGGGIGGFLNDNLRRFAIIPRAMSDAELQTLTT